jgi:hypothetical protein
MACEIVGYIIAQKRRKVMKSIELPRLVQINSAVPLKRPAHETLRLDDSPRWSQPMA